MANDRKNATVPVFNTMFERSNIAAKYGTLKIRLSSDWKKIHGKKQKNFVFSFFILLKWQQIGNW